MHPATMVTSCRRVLACSALLSLLTVATTRALGAQGAASGDSTAVTAIAGRWTATGVTFQSHGRVTTLSVQLASAPGGTVTLRVPPTLGLPGGTHYLLHRSGPRTFLATDRAGRRTEFRVTGPARAELRTSGAAGSGWVTYQFDSFVPAADRR